MRRFLAISLSLLLPACDVHYAIEDAPTFITQWDFTRDTAVNYTYDPTRVDLSSGAAKIQTTDDTISDSTSPDFHLGTFTDTIYDATTGMVTLNTGMTSGTFRSRILDIGAISQWDTLDWLPNAPYGKNIPDNRGRETAYPTENFNASGNRLLFHFTELPGVLTYADSSGSTNDGICVVGICPTTAEGKLGLAGTFDGINDALTISDADSLDFTSAFTIFAWVNTTDTMGTILSHMDAGGGHAGYAFVVGDGTVGLANGRLGLWSDGAGGWVGGGAAVNDGAWHHVAVTYDGTNAKFYIDGALTHTAAMAAPTASSNSAYVGTNPDGYFFDGTMDELAAFNRTLSSTEILNAYKRGAVRMKIQLRPCDDALCAGETFFGPDVTADTYFSEQFSSSLGTPSLSMITVLWSQYLQYEVTLETDNLNYLPSFSSIAANYRVHTAVIQNKVAPEFGALLYLQDTPAAGNLGIAKYQISNDGVNWYYYDTNLSTWVQAAHESFSEASYSVELLLGMRVFHKQIGTGKFYYKAFLRRLLGSPELLTLQLTAFKP